MKFGSWTFEVVDLDIHADASPLHSAQYVRSAEWDLMSATKKRNVESYGCCKFPFSDVTVKFVFKRKPLFYIFNLIVPCMIIMSMVPLGFFLPPESGERIALSITVLLAMAVFLQLAAENLPRNSESVPVMGIFYITVMVEVASSLVATCFILHIHHRNSGLTVVPVPAWINVYVLNKLGRMLGVNKPYTEDKYDQSTEKDFKMTSIMKREIEKRITNGNSSVKSKLLNEKSPAGASSSLNPPEEFCMNCSTLSVSGLVPKAAPSSATNDDSNNANVAQGIMILAESLKHRREVEKNQEEWRNLAIVLDRLFFWIFFSTIVVSTIVTLTH